MTAAVHSAAHRQPETVSDARDLKHRLEQARERDADYQIIQRMLAARKGEDCAPQSRASPASEPAAGDAPEPPSGQRESPAVAIQIERETQVAVNLELRSESQVVRVRMESARRESLVLVAAGGAEPQRTDPLVLDLDGDGVETTGVARGIDFDMDADGQAERTSVAAGGDAFLALDRNGNGRIDSGAELFGDQHGAAHGFAELARFDDNGDGRIDAADPVFGRLRLLALGADGAQILHSLTEAGIAGLDLGYREVERALGDDRVAQEGQFQRVDGSTGQLADVLLARA